MNGNESAAAAPSGVDDGNRDPRLDGNTRAEEGGGGGAGRGGGGDGGEDTLSKSKEKCPQLSINLSATKMSCMLLHRNDTKGTDAYIRSMGGHFPAPTDGESPSAEKANATHLDVADVTPLQERPYNVIYNAAVNTRAQLDLMKLVPITSEIDKRKNLVWQACRSSDMASSPLKGVFTVVVASFEEVGPNPSHRSGAPLFPTYGTEEQDVGLHAVPADAKRLTAALKWLKGEDSNSRDDQATVNDLSSLSESFIRELEAWDIPNAPACSLKKFVQDRNWSVPPGRLWGGNRDSFLRMVDAINDDWKQWMLLRSFICCNMAWVTKLVLFPVDSLHRAVTLDTVYRGVPPPEAEQALQKRVIAFGERLKSGRVKDNGNHFLAIRPEHGGERDDVKEEVIEVQINLLCLVPHAIDNLFLTQMRDLSAVTQEHTGNQSDHHVLHMLHQLMLKVASDFSYRYLLCFDRDDERVGGLERIMRGLPSDGRRQAFKTILTTDGLCTEEEAEGVACDIEHKRGWTDWVPSTEAALLDAYTSVWIWKISGVIFGSVSEFVEVSPNIANIDKRVGLSQQMEGMTLEEFRQVFRTHSSNNYTTKTDLGHGPILGQGFRLDPEQQQVGDPFVLQKFGSASAWDPLDGDPYKKPYRPTKNAKGKNQQFSPHFLDLMWALMRCMLSKQSYDAWLSYSSGKQNCPHRFRQRSSEEHDEQQRARRSLRSLNLAISAAAGFSRKVWYPGFFRKQDGSHSLCPDKPQQATQLALLIISANVHTCPFFSDVGLNAAPPDWAESPSIELQDKLSAGSSAARSVLRDYMSLLMVAFCQQMLEHYNGVRNSGEVPRIPKNRRVDLSKKRARLLYQRWLNPSLRADFANKMIKGVGLNVDRITGERSRLPDDTWIGDLTENGRENMLLRADPQKFQYPRETVVQLLGKAGCVDYPNLTHRIDLFAAGANEGYWEFIARAFQAQEAIVDDDGGNPSADDGENLADVAGAGENADSPELDKPDAVPESNAGGKETGGDTPPGEEGNAKSGLGAVGSGGVNPPEKQRRGAAGRGGVNPPNKQRIRSRDPYAKCVKAWKTAVLPSAVNMAEKLKGVTEEATEEEIRTAICQLDSRALIQLGTDVLVHVAQAQARSKLHQINSKLEESFDQDLSENEEDGKREEDEELDDGRNESVGGNGGVTSQKRKTNGGVTSQKRKKNRITFRNPRARRKTEEDKDSVSSSKEEDEGNESSSEGEDDDEDEDGSASHDDEKDNAFVDTQARESGRNGSPDESYEKDERNPNEYDSNDSFIDNDKVGHEPYDPKKRLAFSDREKSSNPGDQARGRGKTLITGKQLLRDPNPDGTGTTADGRLESGSTFYGGTSTSEDEEIDAGQGKRKYHGKDEPRPTKNLKGNHDSAEDDGSAGTDVEDLQAAYASGLKTNLDPEDTIFDGDDLVTEFCA